MIQPEHRLKQIRNLRAIEARTVSRSAVGALSATRRVVADVLLQPRVGKAVLTRHTLKCARNEPIVEHNERERIEKDQVLECDVARLEAGEDAVRDAMAINLLSGIDDVISVLHQVAFDEAEDQVEQMLREEHEPT